MNLKFIILVSFILSIFPQISFALSEYFRFLVDSTPARFARRRPWINILADRQIHPELPGAGRIVAVGERDFLIDVILNKKGINKTEIKEDIEEFPKYIEFNDACILISAKFYVEIFTKLMHRIDYEERYPRLDYQYSIIPVPEKVLSNKIIIIDKDAVFWKKQIFDNNVLGKKEKLDINIKPVTGGKVSITIKSLNKITYINTELIKILEIKDEILV